MKKIILVMIFTLSLVGCKKTDDKKMVLNVLKSTKENNQTLTSISQKNNNQTNLSDEEKDTTIEDVEMKNIEPLLVYNYLSLNQVTTKDVIEVIESKKEWDIFDGKNEELYSLLGSSPLKIEEEYFDKNILVIISNSNFSNNRLIKLSEAMITNNSISFVVKGNLDIDTIDNYDKLSENIKDIDDIINSQYLILGFNRKDIQNLNFSLVKEE